MIVNTYKVKEILYSVRRKTSLNTSIFMWENFIICKMDVRIISKLIPVSDYGI